MIKGYKMLVRGLISSVKGCFEKKYSHYIPKYRIFGTTRKCPLCDKDTKERFFHIYYDSRKALHDKEAILEKINEYEKSFTKKLGKSFSPDYDAKKYFNFEISEDGKLDRFEYNEEAIESVLDQVGYFAIITSEDMSPSCALSLYKSRDISEKLFRMDKSYLGNCSERTHSSESTFTKMFVSFVALIVRNEMYVMLQKKSEEIGCSRDYLTVEGAIDQLENFKIVRTSKYDYHLAYALTKKQKIILSAFGISPAMAEQKAINIGRKLKNASMHDPKSPIYAKLQ